MNITRSKCFVKQFKKLSLKTQDQFTKRLNLFIENPAHLYLKVHGLSGEYIGYFSFNVNADVRTVFYEAEDGSFCFTSIGTHSQLYK